jgi:tetratricopeptide (TPR) repeat protein/CHAT domain-containing protein
VLRQVSTLCLCLMIAVWPCIAPQGAASQVRPDEKAGRSDELDEALRLSIRIKVLREEGKYAEAIPLAKQVVVIVERVFGTDNFVVASMLSSLALLYAQKGELVQVEPLLQRALSINEKTFGQDHEEVAESLNKLAQLYIRTGDLARAEPLQRRALAVYEKALGPDHLTVAAALNDLAKIYEAGGDFARAEPLYLRSLSIREKSLTPNHPSVAMSLNNLALLYKTQGDLARAEPLYERALAVYERTLGADHPNVATSLGNLATLYTEKGDFSRAESLYKRALSINEKMFGPNHPSVALSLNNRGGLYLEKGDFKQAESLFQRALSIYENAPDFNYVGVAALLNNLATLSRMKGDFMQAESLYKRAITAYEKAHGPHHPDVARSLSNLAELYVAKGDLTRAEPLYERALSTDEKVLGPDHPLRATSLNNLAVLYHQKGDLARAEPSYRRAITVYEKTLGPDHSLVATSLNNLAELHRAKMDIAGAEPLYDRALSINIKALGPNHPNVATSLNNLAAMYEVKGDLARAIQLQSRGQEVEEHNLSLILASGSERQKLAYLVTLFGDTYRSVSLHARSAPSAPQALQLSLTTILQRKGRALDAMADQVTSLRRRLDPQGQALLDQLSAAQSQLSKLVLDGPGNKSPDEYRAAVSQLEVRVERLQDTVGKRSAEFKVQAQPITTERVRRALPPGAALVEFFSYRPFDAKAQTPAERWGLPRYVAYVLAGKGEPLWVDLGEAAAVEADVSRLLIAFRCPQTVDDLSECPAALEVKRLARAADEKVMRPVRNLLGDVRHVFISPDGALNLLPFAALVDEEGKYLVENYSLTYLTSGRDLLRLQLSADSREPPLVVANPAFGTVRRASASVRRTEVDQPRRSTDMVEVDFTPLPGTAAEAKALAALLPGARVLTQARAAEATVKRVHGPRLVHIATHGFFLSDQPKETTSIMRGLGLVYGGGMGPRTLARSENPLLRSGLALAGANLPPEASSADDGILTALEVSALDLWGTKLVVLSACETGIGEVKTGEGVYGLRRALVLAGSESQLMSLWQVADEATKDLMVGYYKRLLAGGGRTDALRQVQLEMLRSERRTGRRRVPRLRSEAVMKADHSHPYYWASFIQSGDWRGISPQPDPAPR